MATRAEDRVLETSTTTGTGDITLAGAVTGFRTFDAALTAADVVPYYIEAVDGDGVPTGAWESGIGTYNGSNVLARTTVKRSSNANAAVNFAAGTKRVGLGVLSPIDGDTRGLWKALLQVALDELVDVDPTGKSMDDVLTWDGSDWVPAPPANPVEVLAIAISDEATALTVGTAKVTFRMPYAFTLTALPRLSVTTAPTGAALVVDINENGTTILSTKLSIDATEKTSTTATTPAVVSDANLADDAEITIDIDQVGSTIAGAGAKVYLIGQRV